MVCPNCGSSDIISVQGQNFCINCGKSVPASSDGAPAVTSKEAAAAAADALATASAALNDLEKGGPEPVEAPATPTPVEPPKDKASPPPAAAVSPELPESPLPKIINHKHAAMEQVQANATEPDTPAPIAKKVVIVPTTGASAKEPAKPAPPTVAPAAITKEPATAKPKPEPTPRPAPASHPAKVLRDLAPAAQHPTSAHRPPQPSPTPNRPVVRVAASIGLALRAASNAKLIGFGLLGVMLSSLVPAAAWTAYVTLPDPTIENALQVVTDHYRTSVMIVASLLGVISAGYLLRLYASGAVIYGEAKFYDRRGATPRSWSRAALASMPSAAMLDILTAVAVAILGVAAIGLYKELPLVINGPQWLYLAITALGSLFLVLALLGLLWSRLIAQNATTLGSYGAYRALTLGWVIYWQQWGRLLGAFLLLTVLNILGFAVYAGLSMLAAIGLSGDTSLATLLIAGLTGWLVATLVFSSLLILNTTAVYHLYRQSVAAHPEDAPQLLAGRHAHKPPKALPIIGTAAVAGLVAAVVVLGQYLQVPITSALSNL